MDNVAQLSLYYVNLMLFIVALAHYGKLLFKVWKMPVNSTMGRRSTDIITEISTFKRIGIVTSVCSIGICSTFIILQLDWIFQWHNQTVGETTSYLWLIFDYFLAFYMLSVATIVDVLFKWKGGFPPSKHNWSRLCDY